MCESNPPPAVLLHEVSVRFKVGASHEVTALDNVSLRLTVGEQISVVGGNGSGKSTLLRIIAGLLRPSEGAVWIDGRLVTEAASHLRQRNITLVEQAPENNCIPEISVEENLCMAVLKQRKLGLRRCPRRQLLEAVGEVLKWAGLSAAEVKGRLKAEAGALSGGQRQVLALLMAMCQNPAVLLLDEHTASLDVTKRRTVNELTHRLVERGNLTVITVSHSIPEALAMSDRLMILGGGRIIEDVQGWQKARLNPEYVERVMDQQYGASAVVTTGPIQAGCPVT